MEKSSLEVAEMEENKEVKEGNSEIEKMDELSDHFKCKKGGIITMPFIFGKLLCNVRVTIFFSPLQSAFAFRL